MKKKQASQLDWRWPVFCGILTLILYADGPTDRAGAYAFFTITVVLGVLCFITARFALMPKQAVLDDSDWRLNLTSDWVNIIASRAYRLGYLESRAGMPVREDVLSAISDATYKEHVGAAAGKAMQGIFVDSAMRDVEEILRIRSQAEAQRTHTTEQ